MNITRISARDEWVVEGARVLVVPVARGATRTTTSTNNFGSAPHIERCADAKPPPSLVEGGGLVGMGGLEPPASTSRTWRATKLRYIP